MEYHNKILCVNFKELTTIPEGYSDPVMSIPNYKRLVAACRLISVRKARGLDSYALIEFATMPTRFRERYIERYGDPEQVMKEQNETDSIPIDTEAREFYEAYRLPSGDTLPVEKIEEYTINASMLNEAIRIMGKKSAWIKSLGGSTGRVWEMTLDMVEKFRFLGIDEGSGPREKNRPWHSLPVNRARLREKINEYKKEGYRCLISGKFGNNNTIKITEEVGRWVIARRRSRVPVYTVEQIFAEYNRVAPVRGWKPMKSEHALRLFLGRPDIEPLWYDAVYGELASKQRYGRKNRTIMPTMRDSLWYADGTKLNLYYKAYENGRLVMKSTQVYEVMDAYSEVLLGFHISDSEDFRAQYRAFRMAIETAGCRPYEIVTDNQGGHKRKEATEFFDKITGSVRRFTAPYNPQSKSIESLFGRFQAQFLHKDWRFTGQNITTKSEKSRPNIEFILANQEHLFTLEELLAAYAAARTEWNLAAHPATGRPRIEMYRDSLNPEEQPVGANDMVSMFWTMTEQPSTFTSSGITITVEKRKYTYEPLDADGMPDMEFRRKHTYRKLYTMYDPLDMTRVKLYEKTATGFRFLADAVPYIEIQRNIQEQREGDMAFIRRQDRINKQERIDRQLWVAELEMEHGVAPEQHGLNRPRIKGINLSAAESMMMPEKATKNTRSKKPSPIDIGLIEKTNSNITFDRTKAYDKF